MPEAFFFFFFFVFLAPNSRNSQTNSEESWTTFITINYCRRRRRERKQLMGPRAFAKVENGEIYLQLLRNEWRETKAVIFFFLSWNRAILIFSYGRYNSNRNETSDSKMKNKFSFFFFPFISKMYEDVREKKNVEKYFRKRDIIRLGRAPPPSLPSVTLPKNKVQQTFHFSIISFLNAFI